MKETLIKNRNQKRNQKASGSCFIITWKDRDFLRQGIEEKKSLPSISLPLGKLSILIYFPILLVNSNNHYFLIQIETAETSRISTDVM